MNSLSFLKSRFGAWSGLLTLVLWGVLLWGAPLWAQSLQLKPPELLLPEAPSSEDVAPNSENSSPTPQNTADPESTTQTTTPLLPLIEMIDVAGLRKADVETVTRVLLSKSGARLDLKTINADIKAIFATQLFRDVVVKKLPGKQDPQKIILIYEVTEKPGVRSVEFEGNDELSKDDIKGTIDIKSGTILDVNKITANVTKIRELYLEKGFYLAEVTYRLKSLSNNEVGIVFVIQENSKVEVKKVTFLGNHHVSDSDLKSQMTTREGNLLSFITSSGTYREEAFQLDLMRITSVYFDRGYLKARILEPQVQLSPDRRFIYITIPVDEGQQYKMGKIDFSGQLALQEGGKTLVSLADIKRGFDLKPGEVFNRSKLAASLQEMGNLYKDYGYAYANVTPLTVLNEAERTVDFNFEVELGEKVYIERIEIEGNSKTRDKVVRRELRIYEGEPFSLSALEESKMRVGALGYFEVDPPGAPPEKFQFVTERGSKSNMMNVIIKITEKQTGTFNVGGGFASIDGFNLFAQIAQQNFLGRGQSMSLNGQISFGRFSRQQINFSFFEPYFFDTKWRFVLNLYLTQQLFTDFQRATRGGSIGFGYPLNRRETLSMFGSYRLDHIEIINDLASLGVSSAQNNSLFNLNQRGLISSFKLELQYDTRDNRLYPTRGHFDTLSLEVADKYTGADFNFIRALGNARYYHPLGAGFVFKGQLSGGWIWSRSPRGVPISERFYVGGILYGSVRGFRPMSIGPALRIPVEGSDPASALRLFNYGGDKKLEMNLELEFPLIEKAGIRGVVFADAGNAYDDTQNFFYIKSDKARIPNAYVIGSNKPIAPPLGLFYSVGMGFRWFSPMGILRFEWGFPITKLRPEHENYLFEFTIGNPF